MTKAEIMKALEEIGDRFAKSDCEDVQKYLELGLAFGVAYTLVKTCPPELLERMATLIEDDLEGSVH